MPMIDVIYVKVHFSYVTYDVLFSMNVASILANYIFLGLKLLYCITMCLAHMCLWIIRVRLFHIVLYYFCILTPFTMEGIYFA